MFTVESRMFKRAASAISSILDSDVIMILFRNIMNGIFDHKEKRPHLSGRYDFILHAFCETKR